MRGRPQTFTHPLVFGRITQQWRDWKRGIVPSSEWKGRGAQNPNLLAAFAELDRSEALAERDNNRR